MALISGAALQNDVFVPLPGADTLTALAGNDVIVVAAPADHPAGEKVDGGTGYDRLWFGSTSGILLLGATDLALEFVQIANAVGDATGTAAVNIDASGYAS